MHLQYIYASTISHINDIKKLNLNIKYKIYRIENINSCVAFFFSKISIYFIMYAFKERQFCVILSQKRITDDFNI